MDTDCAPLVMIYFFSMNLVWTDLGLSVELMSAGPVGGMSEMCINVNFLQFYFMLLFFCTDMSYVVESLLQYGKAPQVYNCVFTVEASLSQCMYTVIILILHMIQFNIRNFLNYHESNAT